MMVVIFAALALALGYVVGRDRGRKGKKQLINSINPNPVFINN